MSEQDFWKSLNAWERQHEQEQGKQLGKMEATLEQHTEDIQDIKDSVKVLNEKLDAHTNKMSKNHLILVVVLVVSILLGAIQNKEQALKIVWDFLLTRGNSLTHAMEERPVLKYP